MGGPVGVKGRPQACITCRRRKKGCDLQRPTCGQCRKASIPCGGYTSRAPGGSSTTTAGTSTAPSGTGATMAAVGATTLPVTTCAWEHAANSSASTTSGPPSGSDFIPEHYYPTPPSSSSMTLALHQRTPVQPASVLASSTPSKGYLEAPYDSSEPWTALRSPNYSPTPPLDNSHHTQVFPHSHQTERQRQHRLHKLRQRFLQQQQQLRGASDLSYSGTLSRSAEDGRLIGVFWEAYLPNSQPFPEGIFQVTFSGSISAMHNLAYSNKGIRNGLLALGLTTVGKRNGAGWMLEAGFRIYGDALQQVATSITRQGPWSPDPLIATRLFSLYEALFGSELQTHASQSRSWMLHSSGEAAIIAANSPHAYIRGQNHDLFIAGRHHMALSAMVARKKTFLSEPAWKTIPWLEHEKSPRDHLLDVMVDFPTIIEGIEAISSWEDAEKKEAYRKLLRHAAFDITDRLLAWQDRYAVAVLPRDLVEELPQFIVPDDLAATHLMSLYWGFSMRLFSVHRTLRRAGEQLEDRIDPDDCCRNLVRAVRLLVHPGAGMFRTHIGPFPFSTALQYLNAIPQDKMVPERLSLLTDLNDPQCIMIREFVESMDPLQAASIHMTRVNEEAVDFDEQQ